MHDFEEQGFTKRIPNRARVHIIKKEQLPGTRGLRKINKIVKGFDDLKRGDIIQLEWLDYRNDGTYLYDGSKVINLDDNPDDYGTIPEGFCFPEFDIRYWYERIVHNCYFRIDDSYRHQLVSSIKTDKSVCDLEFKGPVKMPLREAIEKGFEVGIVYHSDGSSGSFNRSILDNPKLMNTSTANIGEQILTVVYTRFAYDDKEYFLVADTNNNATDDIVEKFKHKLANEPLIAYFGEPLELSTQDLDYESSNVVFMMLD